MKKAILAIMSIIGLTFSFALFAAGVASAPKLDEATKDSLKISWGSASGSLGYFVHYGKETGVTKGYTSQVPDFIETTSATIPNLTPGTKYYVAVTAVDANGDEGAPSSEGIFSTLSASGTENLAFQSLKILDTKTIQLSVNLDIDSSDTATREFKVVERATAKELPIEKVTLSGSKDVQIVFVNALAKSTKYDMTTISLFAKNGKTIESGAAGLVSFTTPSDFFAANLNANVLEIPAVSNGNMNSAGNSAPTLLATTASPPTVGTGNSSSQQEVFVASDSDHSGNVGRNIERTELSQSTDTAMNASEKLPKTGPEITILFIFSLLVGGFLAFYFQKKRTS